jgi:hypothetical protein
MFLVGCADVRFVLDDRVNSGARVTPMSNVHATTALAVADDDNQIPKAQGRRPSLHKE